MGEGEVGLLPFGYVLYPEGVSLMAPAKPKEIDLTEDFRFTLRELGLEGTAWTLEGIEREIVAAFLKIMELKS